MGSKVKISPGFFLMGALALLMLPLRWVMGAILAALVHELFHLLAVWLSRGEVLSLSFGAFGAKMEVSPMTGGKEAFCALAGPLGSFSMLLLAEYNPEAALCGLVQGVYNLLPFYPLDGGRVLNCLLPEAVCFGIRAFYVFFLSGLGFWIATYDTEIGTILLLSLWLPMLLRKITCKAE